jgi:cellulose synthase/poly-beta-1,6-N-acetylglucosamine synthase-like glycosyltransferase
MLAEDTPAYPWLDRFASVLYGCAALLGAALVAALALTGPLAWAVGFVYIAYDTWLLGYMVWRARQAVAERAPGSAFADRALPSVAVLIAARNERDALPLALDALLGGTDRPEQLVVIDDGSSDDSAAVLAARYGLCAATASAPVASATIPGLSLLTRPGGGKARALNAALPHVHADVVVTLDADTIVEPGALAAVRRAFAARPALVAACGVLRPVCAGGPWRRLFELYQRFEYLRSFLWRVVWAHDHTLVLVSGAFACFRREALVGAGGFDPTSKVEDYELLFRLHRRALESGGAPPEVRVLDEARATTDAPARPGVFLRQRTRWFAGFLETMFRNRDMVGSARHGRLGSFHLLVKTVDTLLPLYALSALVALALLLWRGGGIPVPILVALAAKFLYDLGCHVYGLFLHERWQGRRVTRGVFARAALATLTEPYGFQLLRQLGALSGWLAFLRGGAAWTPQRPVHRP